MPYFFKYTFHQYIMIIQLNYLISLVQAHQPTLVIFTFCIYYYENNESCKSISKKNWGCSMLFDEKV